MAFSHVPSDLDRMKQSSHNDSPAKLPRLSVSVTKNSSFLRRKSFKKIDLTPFYTKNVSNIVLTRTQTASIATRMQVGQRELLKLKKCFDKIDFDGSGSIDYSEFYDFLQEPKTVFSDRLFQMIEMNNDGTIDLEEFVHAMIFFCTFGREEMLQFTFNIFDTERAGFIRCRECRPLINLVNANGSLFPGNVKHVLSAFDRNQDGLLDFKEFKVLNARFPLLLFPSFRLQETMQRSTLGQRQWMTLRRKALAGGKPEIKLPKLSMMKSFKKLLGTD
uniref:Uncharacterized protein AlNc14C193G8493 n=1 Tax=Albugo laibachii Nc14 TaxID=890382 RepID=F0WQ11_9STRA|nr:conserved hypothetical protein [Albugo laibachii Nc14]|eukprot:CCA23416.1 conserved hypothetical protein [Albugo laibachii Nc14]